MSSNNTGVLGIDYQEVSKIANSSDTDWMRFIKEDSDDLTQTGQKLFQLAVKSYVYSVLGAQARTHWPIVGQGAKWLQTQDIFHRRLQNGTEDSAEKNSSLLRSVN